MNKFEAIKEYKRGIAKCLLRDAIPIEPDFKWEHQTGIFMEGYTFAAEKLKHLVYEDGNRVLSENGFEPIGIIKLAGSGSDFINAVEKRLAGECDSTAKESQ